MRFDDPNNSALDALYDRAATRPEARPAFLQALLEYELYTLIPRGQSTRPADQVQRPAPERRLPLMRWGAQGRECYHLYTSAVRARRGLIEFKTISREPLLIIGKPGELLLRSMQRPGTGICVNPGKGELELTFNDEALLRILDGTLFDPAARGPGEQESGSARPLNAEEYPMGLVQPVFDHLKTRPEVMAAWVLAPEASRARGERLYVFALLTAAEDTDALCHSVQIVLTLVDTRERAGLDFAVTTLDYSDPAIAAMMRTSPPFYAAPDYRPAP